jgi:hypothetical protein
MAVKIIFQSPGTVDCINDWGDAVPAGKKTRQDFGL